MKKSEFEVWEETFRPVDNPNSDGPLFETHAADFDLVKAADPCCVWTLVDTDSGQAVIVNGLFLVNRVGYFITELPLLVEKGTLEIVIE